MCLAPKLNHKLIQPLFLIWFMEKKICDNCRPFFEELKKRIEELEKKLKAYENAHTPSSKSKIKYPKRQPTGNKIGAPKGHKGTTRAQKNPDKIIDLTQKQCPHCIAKLDEPIATKKRIIEDIPEPQPITVTQYNQNIYECPQCEKIIVAEHSDLPEKGNFGYS